MSSAALEIRSEDPRPNSFDSLSDDDLHAAARRLTARSNIALADLLAHLGEVESRGIHRNRACASLYTYCIYELRMSEDAAFRRAKAARFVHRHAELRGMLARGELHLTGLLMIAPHLGGERHAELLERARFRTKREITRILAEIDPKPTVAARIVPIATATTSRATHQALVESLAGPVRHLPAGDHPEDWVETAPADGKALDAAERALESAGESRQSSSDRPMSYEIRFAASQEYVDLLDEALDLLGEPRKAARMPEVQLRALRDFVERLRSRRTGRRAVSGRDATPSTAPARREEPGTAPARRTTPPRRTETNRDAPERREETNSAETREETGTAPARRIATNRDATPSTAPPRRTETNRGTRNSSSQSAAATHRRYVPVAIRRAVWDRDAARCTYVDDRGRRCAETLGLDVHHRRAYALGGPSTVDNLELRCRAHNDLAAEQDFGRAHMGQFR